MRYCIIKNTVDVLDSHQDDKTMLQSAKSSGFEEHDVEIITEEEYLERLELEPKPIPELPIEERTAITEDALNNIIMMLL